MTDLLRRLQPFLEGVYDLQTEIGAGGMAHVFLAHDNKHDRNVAVKVFRPELASSLGAERFLREIQIAAKLSHPHILPLYDSGEADGLLYYVMPLVEGESLADRLEREQQLPFDDALQITREVADALNYAHSRGLVHRDIKPDNIMLAGGHAVVADFGIARAVSEAAAGKLTQTGMAVGTPAYMSPEQAMGGDDVDGRADIYSLGCVLFELLVGQIPFTGPTPQAVMARHSMEAVPRPQIVRDTIPDDLEDIILCALAKVPADRFRTAGDFADALKGVGTDATFVSGGSRVTRVRPRVRKRRPQLLTVGLISVGILGAGFLAYQLGIRSPGGGSGVTGPDARRVAVLYFDDLSADGELEHVADGLTERLISQLTQVQELEVVSRNGVTPYRGTDAEPDSIAGALRVGSIVDGNVEAVGENIRFTVRLVDGASGVDLERTNFTLPAVDLLAAQDSVTQEVARLLRQGIGQEVRLREQRAATSSNAAWVLVQRAEKLRKDARALRAQAKIEDARQVLLQADSLLQTAEAADDQWSLPSLVRGRVANQLSRLSDVNLSTAVRHADDALDHAERVLERDPADADGLALRGTVRYWKFYLMRQADPAEAQHLLTGAQQDLEAAVAADGSQAAAHNQLSHLYTVVDRPVDVVLAAQRAYEADVYLAYADDILWRLYEGHYALEQPVQAQRWCEEGHRRFPEDGRFTICQLWVMTTNLVEPDVGEAWRLVDQVDSLAPANERAYQTHLAQVLVGGVLARAGLADSADAVLIAARAGRDVDPDRALQFIEAYMRVLLGDDDVAIDLLKQWLGAHPEQDEHGLSRGTFWWWRDVRNHPRFSELLTGAR